MIYQSGNTLRLECQFKGFDESIIAPDLTKCRIYNYKKEQIAELYLEQVANKYICYYTPTVTGAYFAEFYGEKQGRPILYRQKFEVSFV